MHATSYARSVTSYPVSSLTQASDHHERFPGVWSPSSPSPPSLTTVSIYSWPRSPCIRISRDLSIVAGVSRPSDRSNSVQVPPLPSLSVYKIRTNRTSMNIHRNKGNRAIRISCTILYRASLLVIVVGEVIYSNWRWRKKEGNRTNEISKT